MKEYRMPTAYLDTVDSPAGPLAFAVNEAGALLRTQFVNGRYRTGIERELERDGYALARDPARTARAREQLLAYQRGELRAFDLPLAPAGTEWQRAVWQALTEIPYGETISYGELAARLGRPLSARAVGHANGSNPIPLIVPCHRVIGADGSLTGYGGGLDIKERLLAHEAGEAPTAQAS
jgi:methylated-DNA-[protein]-cysteine S-methyltransferase